MKPVFCEIHGVQEFVITSPKLADAIAHGELIAETDLRKLQIESVGARFEYYFVDSGFLNEFQIISDSQTVSFKDRDKVSKQLNDRLIIQKIVRAMKRVCPDCLEITISKSRGQD